LFALETSYLVPNTTFVVLTVGYLAVFVIWPLLEAARQGRWVWAVAIVLFSPVAGILWFIIDRRWFAWVLRPRGG
jgi:hypothetical protein